jgi:beta-1,4-N-acetylglucosaminyltransferase
MIKECLITTGATAKFPELVEAALSERCLKKFVENGFTRLTFQCGDSMEEFSSLKPVDTKGLDIRGFAFNKMGLNKEIRDCQAKEGVSEEGLVICHAGQLPPKVPYFCCD